jgi:two-component system NarL family response regulator
MQTVDFLLVDDHQIFRQALRSLLEKTRGFKVVGETGNAHEAINLARNTSPDIVCMDIGLPGMNGIQATQLLSQACPGIKIIALSSYADRHYVADMMNAGAAAYVTKNEAADELLRAISAVRNNRKYLCSDIAEVAATSMATQAQAFSPTQLGNRERQVLQFVAEGHTSASIASQMNITTSTVEVHRRNIMRKLNLHKAADLTRYAINNGIIAR